MSAPSLPRSIVDNPLLDQWLSFERQDRVAVLTGKVELGQGILTALAQIAAEELDVGLEQIEMVSGRTARSPDEGFTAGSLSVPIGGSAIRLASAEARALLIAAAAGRLNAEAGQLSVDAGRILRNGERTNLDYWALAGDVDWHRPVTGTAATKPAASYRIVGKSVPRVDLAAKLTGGGFIHDMKLAGMLHARMLRQPFRGAALAAFDEEKLARRHPDIRVVRRNDFVALVAPSEFVVAEAIATATGLADWREHADGWPKQATPAPTELSAGAAPTEGDGRVLQASYARPMIAHASIAPSCALAHLADGHLTVWTHSQGVFPLRQQIARVLSLPPEAVTLIHVHGAGCYGHNAADDAGMDAAILATLLPGTPVRVQWTRAQELSLGPLGGAQEATVEAALGADGRIASWRLDVLSMPHVQRPGAQGQVNLTSAEALDRGFRSERCGELPEAQGGAASRNALAFYDFPQAVTVTLRNDSRVRTSSLRALGATLNVFAIECAMDELAELAGADPLAFRLAHLTETRARAVLEEAGAMSGWSPDEPLGEGSAKGLAVARYKNSSAWLAAVAEVSVEEAVRVDRLWLAVDAGLVINPEGARSQVEGGAIQAVSWTLKEAVPVEDDRVPALDWESYPILRFSEIPLIETRFLEAPGRPALGAGEPSQGPVSAAIANAVTRALGVRIRTMPLTRERIMEAMMAG
jgi:CO/xanthine dehydrogenase Mo-binding subunit